MHTCTHAHMHACTHAHASCVCTVHLVVCARLLRIWDDAREHGSMDDAAEQQHTAQQRTSHVARERDRDQARVQGQHSRETCTAATGATMARACRKATHP